MSNRSGDAAYPEIKHLFHTTLLPQLARFGNLNEKFRPRFRWAACWLTRSRSGRKVDRAVPCSMFSSKAAKPLIVWHCPQSGCSDVAFTLAHLLLPALRRRRYRGWAFSGWRSRARFSGCRLGRRRLLRLTTAKSRHRHQHDPNENDRPFHCSIFYRQIRGEVV